MVRGPHRMIIWDFNSKGKPVQRFWKLCRSAAAQNTICSQECFVGVHL